MSRKNLGSCYYYYFIRLSISLLNATLINCVYSHLFCKTRWKMLVFVRPSFFPLLWLSAVQSIIYSLPFPFDTKLHKCLECLDVSLASMLDTHPLCFSPFLFSIHDYCDQTLGSRSRRPPVPSTTWRSPTTRSSSEVPRQEASPL